MKSNSFKLRQNAKEYDEFNKEIDEEGGEITEELIAKLKKIQGNFKVRDHCHHSGVYRGAAHCKCNLKCKVKNNVDVCIHNGKNYDNHLLMRELHNLSEDKFDVIATNTEKYISFSIYHKSDEEKANDVKRSEKRKIKTSLEGKINRHVIYHPFHQMRLAAIAFR
jgi:hypothetical protein